MQALKFKVDIGEDRTVSLTLPPGARPGETAEVVVLLEEAEPEFKPVSEEVYQKLLHFGDGRKLGFPLKELMAEARGR